MKTVLLLLALLLSAGVASAQDEEQTLVNGDIDIGGFGGVFFRGTGIKHTSATLVGGGGGVVFGHVLYASVIGYSLATNVHAGVNDTAGAPLYINLAAGGLRLQYIYRPNDLVHFTAGGLVGGGTISYGRRNWFQGDGHNDGWDRDDDMRDYGNGTFFVFEPELGAELNITSWCRLEGVLTYRVVGGVDYRGLTNGDIGGISGGAMVKFGKF
jgi:hypothetical protein